VVDATDFGPSCLQPVSNITDKSTGKWHLVGGWNSINVSRTSEDCLTVNVYAPPLANQNAGPLPVMLYLHAGEFHLGSSNDAENNWPYFSNKVVLVTANVRLGPFGFLASAALRKRAANNGTGNYGMLDQRAVMAWVKEHISAFGGDHDAITIFGESSGGTSVGWHLVRPESAPLYNRAILESPGLTQVKPFEKALLNHQFILASLATLGSKDCEVDPGNYLPLTNVVDFTRDPLHTAPHVSLQEAKEWCTSYGMKCAGFYYKSSNDTYVFLKPGEHPFDIGIHKLGGNYTTYLKAAKEECELPCLLNADANLLNDIGESVPRDDTFATDAWAPVVDGVDLPWSIEDGIKSPTFTKSDLLLGTNKDEGTIFMGLVPKIRCNASKADFEDWAKVFYGDEIGEKVPALYSEITEPAPICEDERHYDAGEPAASVSCKTNADCPGSSYCMNWKGKRPPFVCHGGGSSSDSSKWYNAAMRSAGDNAILCPTRSLARAASALNAKVWLYWFTLTPKISVNYDNTSTIGAFHGAEVPFVFGDQFEITGPEEKRLSDMMGCYWMRFAYTGDPNVGPPCDHFKGNPVPWPAYQFGSPTGKSTDYNLELTNGDPSTQSGLHKARCDLFTH